MYHRRLTAGANAARSLRAGTSTRALAVRPAARAAAAPPQTRSLRTSSRLHDLHAQAQQHVNDPETSGLGAQAAAEKKVRDGEAAASFSDPMARYEYLVGTGVLRADPYQKGIIQRLQDFHEELRHYDPGPIPTEETKVEPSFFGKFFTRTSVEHAPIIPLDRVPKGLYLYGSVGTGKTMLMDLFHSTLPAQFRRGGKYGSTRVHFHAFMIEVMQRMHAVTERYVAEGDGKRDAIPEVARSIAGDGRVLCFDEFQVTDIVTAMLLRTLFERLSDFGVVIFITSNRHPDELYQNGLNRELFIPAIDLIKERFNIVDLDSGTDYRKIPRTLTKVYYHPISPETTSEMDKLFHGLASADVDPEIRVGRKLSLWGREVAVPESSGHVARFAFDDLCNKPLSASDYLEITKTFHTIFVEDIPRLTLSERDQARRFITFIDACYENKIRLFVSSAAPLYTIFSADDPETQHAVAQKLDEMGAPSDANISHELFSNDEELFAFARCVSRLTQMSSKEWADECAAAHPEEFTQ